MPDDDDFFNIPMVGLEEPQELDEYLAHPIEKVRDPVAWWWDHRHTYPKLSLMALDYLSIPGNFVLCYIVITNWLFQLHQPQLSDFSRLAAICYTILGTGSLLLPSALTFA